MLRVPASRLVNTRDFRLFSEAIKQHGVGDGENISVEITEQGELKFWVPVPAEEKPKRTKHQEAVKAQIEGRRAKIANGEEVPGYVPPVPVRKVVRIPKQRTGKKRVVRRSKRS